jgi:hypothetical protein
MTILTHWGSTYRKVADACINARSEPISDGSASVARHDAYASPQGLLWVVQRCDRQDARHLSAGINSDVSDVLDSGQEVFGGATVIVGPVRRARRPLRSGAYDGNVIKRPRSSYLRGRQYQHPIGQKGCDRASVTGHRNLEQSNVAIVNKPLTKSSSIGITLIKQRVLRGKATPIGVRTSEAANTSTQSVRKDVM